MTVALRPMTLGEILDRTFRMYRECFGMFLGIALAPLVARLGVQLAGVILGGMLAQTTLSSATKLGLRGFISGLPLDLLWSYLECLSWFAIAAAASMKVLGEPPSLRAAFESCISRWKSWLGISAQLSIALFLVPAFVQKLLLEEQMRSAAAEALFGTPSALNRLSMKVFFLLASWVPQALLLVVLAMSIPLWASAKLNATAALRKGCATASGTWRRTSLTWLMTSLVAWILSASFSYAAYFLVYVTGLLDRAVNRSWHSLGYLLLFHAPVQAASVLARPLFPIALTLLCFDYRIRREGFDIEWMMQSAGMEPAVAPASAPEIEESTPPAPEEQQA